MVISSILNYLNNLLSFSGVNTAYCKPCFIKTYKVFVYGTLKTGEPNHDVLTNSKNGVSTFIAEAKTKKKFPLIIATKYHMPFLLYWPGRGCIVDGEIYEVNVPMLGQLDKLVNPALYTREEIDIGIRMPNGTVETMRCHAFFLQTSLMTEELLSRRYMGKYCSKGKHGLAYISNTTATVEDLEEPLKY